MCDLKSEPWREHFTGPSCRCGVPTAGTPEENAIDLENRIAHREIEKVRNSPRFKAEVAKMREERIAALLRKYCKGNAVFNTQWYATVNLNNL